jgi:hypothetical protein
MTSNLWPTNGALNESDGEMSYAVPEYSRGQVNAAGRTLIPPQPPVPNWFPDTKEEQDALLRIA